LAIQVFKNEEHPKKKRSIKNEKKNILNATVRPCEFFQPILNVIFDIAKLYLMWIRESEEL
jgi:hypothetical protein